MYYFLFAMLATVGEWYVGQSNLVPTLADLQNLLEKSIIFGYYLKVDILNGWPTHFWQPKLTKGQTFLLLGHVCDQRSVTPRALAGLFLREREALAVIFL